jgi:ADP-L-glycero-D-manno-heptose 6-epimerase
MIIVTGAAGFIGSCLIGKLNAEHFKAIVAVDRFDDAQKEKNLAGKVIMERVGHNDFLHWLDLRQEEVEFIFHMDDDDHYSHQERLSYSQQIWKKCFDHQIPLIYASAATGSSGHGSSQSEDEFDLWAMQQNEKPFFWAGLKLFEVYGPNEYYKHRSASFIYQAFQQIRTQGSMQLLPGQLHANADDHRPQFVYVKDVVDVCYFMMRQRKLSGIYPLGTGQTHSYKDAAHAVFAALNLPVHIVLADGAESAPPPGPQHAPGDMEKLRKIGYKRAFKTLEEGVADYVRNYLRSGSYY